MPLEENARTILGQSSNDNLENEEMITQETNELESKDELKNKIENDNSSQGHEEESQCSDVEITSPVEEQVGKNREFDVKQISTDVGCILAKIEESGEVYKNLEQKVIQTLRENSNFQTQVRQNMQKELEDVKKKLSGDIFIPLLKEIAELYIEWQDVINDLEDGVAKRKVKGIFEILEEILEEYGCEFGISEIDSKRKTKYSKLKNKVPTSDKGKHETIAKSYNQWIVKEPFVLYPEYVDVYVYVHSCEASSVGDTDEDEIKREENESTKE